MVMANEQPLDYTRRPDPDPTTLTTAQLLRELFSLREILQAKLDGNKNEVDTRFDAVLVRIDAIDKATVLFEENLTRVPTEVDKAILHLRELIFAELKTIQQQFYAVAQQFEERDTRVREAAVATKTAVDAALQAQKEAFGQQNTTFAQSIEKSEISITKQIDSLVQNQTTQIQSITTLYGDLKDRMTRIESQDIGAKGQREDTHQGNAMMLTVFGAILGIGGFAVAIISLATR
jgi:predicted outer membrane protein